MRLGVVFLTMVIVYLVVMALTHRVGKLMVAVTQIARAIVAAGIEISRTTLLSLRVLTILLAMLGRRKLRLQV